MPIITMDKPYLNYVLNRGWERLDGTYPRSWLAEDVHN